MLNINLIVLLLIRCDWIRKDPHASHLIGSNDSFVHHLHNFQQLVLLCIKCGDFFAGVFGEVPEAEEVGAEQTQGGQH
jgi:hypothetical protein